MPSDRDELLARVYRRATHLRWRRRASVASAASVVILALVATVPRIGAEDGTASLRVAAGGDRTTTVPAAGPGTEGDIEGVVPGGEPGATSASASGRSGAPRWPRFTGAPSGAPPGAGGTQASPTATTRAPSEPAPGPGPTPTTAPPAPPGPGPGGNDPCRNNNGNPACGEFRWARDPGPNAPLQFTISHSPQNPQPGQPVTFTVRVVDPDASPIRDCGPDWDGSGGGCAHTMECATNYGTWDVPPKQRGEATFTHSRTFSAPGTYTVHFHAESMDGSKSRGSCSDRPNPYASDGFGTATLTVG